MSVLFFLVACTGGGKLGGGPNGVDTAPLPCDEREPTVTIGGSGVDDQARPIWTEMPEGSEQTMVHGPQGGWHILASADVQSTNQIVTIEYTIDWPAHQNARVSSGAFRVMLVPDDRCGGFYAGMLGILDVSAVKDGELDTPPEVLAGEALTLRMFVTDLDGLTAEDERGVVAALDPVDAQ